VNAALDTIRNSSSLDTAVVLHGAVSDVVLCWLSLLLQDRMRHSTGAMKTVGYGAANRFGFKPDADSYGR
jgi:hypothetical protein